jgi:hypothetical protein
LFLNGDSACQFVYLEKAVRLCEVVLWKARGALIVVM